MGILKHFYTSYYARTKNHPRSVSISIKPPYYYKGAHYLPLAPSKELLLDYKAGIADDAEYTRRFMIQLSALDPQRVVDNLPNGCILLCYEGLDKFCHRHIVAEWLQQTTGVRVREIMDKDVDAFITHGDVNED
jgi:uncharacterized protein (DUF488 family)